MAFGMRLYLLSAVQAVSLPRSMLYVENSYELKVTHFQEILTIMTSKEYVTLTICKQKYHLL